MEEHNHLEKITLKTLSAFLHADTVEAIGSVMQVLKIFLCNLSVMSTTEMCALLRPIKNESGPLQFHLIKFVKACMAIYHEVPNYGNLRILFVPNLFLIMHFKYRTSLLLHKIVEIFSFPVPRTFTKIPSTSLLYNIFQGSLTPKALIL